MNYLEKELIEKIRNNDTRAFDVVFNRYYSILCTFAADLIMRIDLAEEIVQDVFVKFWDHRNSIHVTTSLKAYLFKMVQNSCYNYIRDHATLKNIKEVSIEDITLQFELLKINDTDSVFDKLWSAEMESDLSKAIESLPDQCKEIFYLCRYEGLTYSEISKKLAISVSTVKTQMSRAMEKLEVVVKKYI
jgi:RNA polymerase sigma-70 factor (ECF subfamily)